MRVSQVYTAAPSEERCAVEMETFALLDRLGIPYTWVAHDMANTIEDCAAVDAALGELRGCAPGSAGVLGLAYDKSHQVHLLMDREVYESEWFGCHPCKSDATLRIQTRDLLNIFFPYTGHPVTVVD